MIIAWTKDELAEAITQERRGSMGGVEIKKGQLDHIITLYISQWNNTKPVYSIHKLPNNLNNKTKANRSTSSDARARAIAILLKRPTLWERIKAIFVKPVRPNFKGLNFHD